jgi:hypothetical protein
MVSVIEMNKPPHEENGIELMPRIEMSNSQMKAHTSLPKYIAAKGIGEIATSAIQPKRTRVDKGIAIIFDTKNNKGN